MTKTLLRGKNAAMDVLQHKLILLQRELRHRDEQHTMQTKDHVAWVEQAVADIVSIRDAIKKLKS